MPGVMPMADDMARLRRACAGPLLRWFETHQRDMPWRRRRTPYRVWVSECMLQQTRVDQARDYFLRWMRRFPSLKSLAEAPLDDVLKQWEGLGYYARARHLHQGARYVRRECGGRFPRTRADWLKVPGVGPYTAAAVASLAFDEDAAVVDGNVIRVLTRLRAMHEEVGRSDTRKQLEVLAGDLLPPGQAGAYNEALMELGATVCTPRRPDCPSCPLRPVCRAAAAGQPEQFPVKAKKKPVPHLEVGAAVIFDRRGRILIAQRREKAMLGGLWEFPGGTREDGESMEACVAREIREELGLRIRVGSKLTVVPHAYSHFTIRLHAYVARIQSGRPRCLECADYTWITPDQFDDYAFSKADHGIIQALRDHQGPIA